MRFYKLSYKDLPYNGGYSKFCFITISKDSKDNKPILLHEIEHVKQFWRICLPLAIIALIMFFAGLPNAALCVLFAGVLGHNLLYTLIRSYRKYAEVKAHRVQYVALDRTKLDELAANLASDNYDLNISVQKARELIKRGA